MIRFLLLLILFIVIARVFWKVIDALMEAARSPDGGGRARPAVKLVRDPVCGTFVQPRTALSATAGGQTHYFCSDGCRKEFSRQ